MSTTDRGGMHGPGRRAPDAHRVHGDKGVKSVKGRSGAIASGAPARIDFD
ncbi:hypothetical protein [Burkholderia cepacia]|nr:hypothetical protein [Burkholderia cepacia]EMD9437368.1 hypothetical protein [Burkholderia cepacia]